MVDWRHRKPVDKFEPLKILAFPLFLENALVIALFSIMFTVASIWAWVPYTGIRSVAFWFISVTLFFNYAFIVVDYTSRGFQRVPKLSGELVFPTHDSRLYTVAVLTIFYLAFVFGGWDTDTQFIRLIIAFFTYPLVFSLLIVNRKVVALLNPIRLVKSLIIFSSSLASLNFYGLQLLVGTLLYFEFKNFSEISPAHIFWEVPLSVTLLFILFRSLGVVLNTQGPRLGIPVLQNEETQLRALEEEARFELSEFVMKLHKLMRVHEYKKAFALIESFQKENSHSLDGNLFERLSQWDDKRLACMLGAGFAERLLKEGDTQRALKVFRESYEMNPRKFKLTSGSRALEFLEAARDAPSRIKVYEYLQRFDEDFPNHPRALDVLMQVAALAANEYDDKTTAIVFLKKAADLKPEIVKTPEYQQLQHELVI